MACPAVTADGNGCGSRLALGLFFVLADELIDQDDALASIGFVEGFPVLGSLFAKLSTLGSLRGVIKVLEEGHKVMLAAGCAGKESGSPYFCVVLQFCQFIGRAEPHFRCVP